MGQLKLSGYVRLIQALDEATHKSELPPDKAATLKSKVRRSPLM